MELFANDLSLHEQFHDIVGFQAAVSRFMRLRNLARKNGREIHCHGNLLSASPLPGLRLREAVGQLADHNQQRAIMSWMMRHGPFWDDLRRHSPDEYLEASGEVVTDTAIGEAAFRNLMGVDSGLLGFSPSMWDKTPVLVTWCRSHERIFDRQTSVSNWWEEEAFETWIRAHAIPPRTWEDLREAVQEQFPRLTFGQMSFTSLKHVPVASSAIERCVVLLNILDQLAGAFDDRGARTPVGHDLYQQYFTGAKALFTDSSTTEKHEFEKQLTFPHASNPGESVFCPWHGKIQHQILRIHFSWPIVAGKLVHIAYIGPKLTRR